MALQSMTGYSSTHNEFNGTAWNWSIKSVNGKGLDARFRLPINFEQVELSAKKIIQKYLTRGNLQISLQLNGTNREIVPVINYAIIDQIAEASKELQKRHGGELPTIGELLSTKGAIEFQESDFSEAERSELENDIVAGFEEAVVSLHQARLTEGQAIAAVLDEQLKKIEKLYNSILADGSRAPEAQLKHLTSQLQKLIGDQQILDAQRLHQEVAILAAKSDIQEELDRLQMHLKSGNDLLDSDGPIGRKLDFLSQELNRECNTICSKSNSHTVTALALEMKLLIEQFREQVQNLE
ncbi:MAG: YicC/YloC family endoribonuclease [Pseudomonadota bacterium]